MAAIKTWFSRYRSCEHWSPRLAHPSPSVRPSVGVAGGCEAGRRARREGQEAPSCRAPGAAPKRGDPERSVGPKRGDSVFGYFCPGRAAATDKSDSLGRAKLEVPAKLDNCRGHQDDGWLWHRWASLRSTQPTAPPSPPPKFPSHPTFCLGT